MPKKPMKHLPSDYKILSEIYNRYYEEFNNYFEGSRSTKIFVPIDLEVISHELKVDPDIVFGRLYYYLNKRYSYSTGDNARVEFFAFKVGSDSKAINFPLLASVLASIHEEQSKFVWATGLSITALIISILAPILSYAL